MKAITIIGMGDDGCNGISSRAMSIATRAQVLAGGERHLAFFPQFEGKRIIIKNELTKIVEEIVESANENTVCVLASGDPLFYGVGPLIAKKAGMEHVEFIPSPSSVQLAFSKVGIKWDDATVISLHGKPLQGLVAKIQRFSKVALLTDDKNAPNVIARHMLLYQESGWKAYVCENLTGLNERVREFALSNLAATEDFSVLNVVILIRDDAHFKAPPLMPHFGEDEYAKRMPKNGLITKKEVRVLSLAALHLRSDSTVWDIGAGSGSMAIEASKIASFGKTFAIEIDPEGVEICKDNALTHRADNVEVIAGRAPEALVALPNPDAVFVGGSKGSLAKIIHLCLDRLNSGGRIVVNAVTLDNVAEAHKSFKDRGIFPEMVMVQASRGSKLAHYMRYDAHNPIHIFSATKPETNHD